MIQELQIKDPDATPVGWWPKVQALQKMEKIEFDPLLTILWGPNGVGKSTIVRALARLTHCEQGGVPKVTSQSIQHFHKGVLSSGEAKDGLSIISDGQPSYYFDPSATVGVFGGAFDDDFFMDGVRTMMIKRNSSGQQTNLNISRIFESSSKDEETDRKALEYLKERSQALYLAASQGLEKTSETMGRKTLLLDEPERSLDIPTQRKVWDVFEKQTKYQIIVATHSPFALWVTGAKYIDLRPGYLDECRATYRDFIGGR